MLARIAIWYTRVRPWFRRFLQFGFLLISLGGFFLLMEAFFFPWATANETLRRLGIFSSLGERMTVVERRETVTITQDENFERLLSEHGAIVARLIEMPQSNTNAIGERMSAIMRTATLVTNDGLAVTFLGEAPRANQRYLLAWGGVDLTPASLVGYDPLTELAFFRVERDNTPAAAFTNTADLKPGRRLALLGTQTSGGLTITPDIVERFDATFNLAPQTVASSEKWEGVFGLSALPAERSIGGPALLMNGEMAGIVGTRTLDKVTTSFILSAEAVRLSLERVLSEGGAARPIVGIYYQSITPERAEILNLPVREGALVYSPSGRTGLSVIAGSPAARAGLQYGDIILSVNGEKVDLDHPLSVRLSTFKRGETITLTILRSGSEREVALAL